MTAPKGYYRNLLSDSNIRIAFTHTPIYGCTVVDSSKVMNELEQSQDEYAPYYLDGLKKGLMITIVENQNSNGYLKPGELYFKS
jgi:predicted transcriptional regulator